MVMQRCVKHIMTSFKKFLFLLLFCSCHTRLRHPITVSPPEDWQWILLFLIPISPLFFIFFLSHQPSVFFSAISHQCFFLSHQPSVSAPQVAARDVTASPHFLPQMPTLPKNQPPTSSKNQPPSRKVSPRSRRKINLRAKKSAPTSRWNKTSLQQDTSAL